MSNPLSHNRFDNQAACELDHSLWPFFLVFPLEIEMATTQQRIKTNGQSFCHVTLISLLFRQILAMENTIVAKVIGSPRREKKVIYPWLQKNVSLIPKKSSKFFEAFLLTKHWNILLVNKWQDQTHDISKFFQATPNLPIDFLILFSVH